MVFADPYSWGWEYIIIMLWQGEAYGQPLIIMEGSKLPGRIHYSPEDWTGDGIVEIVWRASNGTSGSGYYETTKKPYLIQRLMVCNVIWEYKTSVDSSYVPGVSGSLEFPSYECSIKVDSVVIGASFKCTRSLRKSGGRM